MDSWSMSRVPLTCILFGIAIFLTFSVGNSQGFFLKNFLSEAKIEELQTTLSPDTHIVDTNQNRLHEIHRNVSENIEESTTQIVNSVKEIISSIRLNEPNSEAGDEVTQESNQVDTVLRKLPVDGENDIPAPEAVATNIEHDSSNPELNIVKIPEDDNADIATALENNIRSSVKDEIQVEQIFESSAIDVIEDIPEPEVRQTLTEDLMAIEYPQSVKKSEGDLAKADDTVDSTEAPFDTTTVAVIGEATEIPYTTIPPDVEPFDSGVYVDSSTIIPEIETTFDFKDTTPATEEYTTVSSEMENMSTLPDETSFSEAKSMRAKRGFKVESNSVSKTDSESSDSSDSSKDSKSNSSDSSNSSVSSQIESLKQKPNSDENVGAEETSEETYSVVSEDASIEGSQNEGAAPETVTSRTFIIDAATESNGKVNEGVVTAGDGSHLVTRKSGVEDKPTSTVTNEISEDNNNLETIQIKPNTHDFPEVAAEESQSPKNLVSPSEEGLTNETVHAHSAPSLNSIPKETPTEIPSSPDTETSDTSVESAGKQLQRKEHTDEQGEQVLFHDKNDNPELETQPSSRQIPTSLDDQINQISSADPGNIHLEASTERKLSQEDSTTTDHKTNHIAVEPEADVHLEASTEPKLSQEDTTTADTNHIAVEPETDVHLEASTEPKLSQKDSTTSDYKSNHIAVEPENEDSSTIDHKFTINTVELENTLHIELSTEQPIPTQEDSPTIDQRPNQITVEPNELETKISNNVNDPIQEEAVRVTEQFATSIDANQLKKLQTTNEITEEASAVVDPVNEEETDQGKAKTMIDTNETIGEASTIVEHRSDEIPVVATNEVQPETPKTKNPDDINDTIEEVPPTVVDHGLNEHFAPVEIEAETDLETPTKPQEQENTATPTDDVSNTLNETTVGQAEEAVPPVEVDVEKQNLPELSSFETSTEIPIARSNEDITTPAIVQTIIEAAELTTEFARHVDSFRTIGNEASAVPDETISSAAAGRTSNEIIAEGLGKPLPTRSVGDEPSSSSYSSEDKTTTVVVLCSATGIIFIAFSVAMYLITFQRQHGTLDIEMQEQRCGKDDLEDDEDAETRVTLLHQIPPAADSDEHSFD